MTKSITKVALILATLLGIAAHADSQLQMRTQQVGEEIVGVTNDGRFFAIACKNNLVFKSSAFLLAPNSKGDIVTDLSTGYQISAGSPERSPKYPLTTEATLKVCNFPNGIYTLNLTQKDGANIVEFVNGQSADADSGKSARGF
jgi:hypothetical protein